MSKLPQTLLKKLQKDWIQQKAYFNKNQLKVKGYQVMQTWEDNYMKDLADVGVSEGGDILEIGFGLGIAASYIQQARKIKSHTIIECHPDVIAYAIKKFKNSIMTGRMLCINGFWENVTPKLKDGLFDGILFDTNPINHETVFFHFFPFFKEAHRLLKKGGVFTYFSDEEKVFSKKHFNQLKLAGFSKIDSKICRVNPIRPCRYWKYKTILVPMIYK